MAAALANATAGVWNTTGNDAGNLWIDRSLHPPATLTFVIGAAQAQNLDEDKRSLLIRILTRMMKIKQHYAMRVWKDKIKNGAKYEERQKQIINKIKYFFLSQKVFLYYHPLFEHYSR